jgi:hypothetical protein
MKKAEAVIEAMNRIDEKQTKKMYALSLNNYACYYKR